MVNLHANVCHVTTNPFIVDLASDVTNSDGNNKNCKHCGAALVVRYIKNICLIKGLWTSVCVYIVYDCV